RLATRHAAPQGLHLLLRLPLIHPPQPLPRTRHRPFAQQRLRFIISVRAPPEARPSPVLSPRHELRPQGIALHVATDRQEVLIRLHWKRFEPALVQVPGTDRTAGRMPALGVCHGQPAKERGQITIGTWPHHQVPVIGHHTIGEESHPHPLTRFRQHSLERLIITILGKELHSGISTVQDVIYQPTQGYAARSRHAITLPTAKWRVKKNAPEPFPCSRIPLCCIWRTTASSYRYFRT